MPIDQILGEMGEVCIKGEILEFDSREIRNEKTILMFAVSDFTDTSMVKMFCKNEYLDEIVPILKKGSFVFALFRRITAAGIFSEILPTAFSAGSSYAAFPHFSLKSTPFCVNNNNLPVSSIFQDK